MKKRLLPPWVIENFISLFLALLAVLAVRSSIVEPFKIPSGSMVPTLLVGDHIFVNKFSYGLKIPFSDWVLDHPVYLWKRDNPKRGDIIVFLFPKDEKVHFIKRVIGTPGDTIEIKDKVLYVNNKAMPQEPVTPDFSTKMLKDIDEAKYDQNSLEIKREKLDDVDHLLMLDKQYNFAADTYGPITVPPDNLFVMGDNRDFSNDSRFWGFVPMKNISGRAFVIWMNIWFSEWGEWPTFRYHRVGTWLK